MMLGGEVGQRVDKFGWDWVSGSVHDRLQFIRFTLSIEL